MNIEAFEIVRQFMYYRANYLVIRGRDCTFLVGIV